MNILVDVDGVLTDFVGAVLKLVNKTKRSEADHWNWWYKYYSPEESKYIEETLKLSHSFWLDLPLVDNAVQGINYLRSHGHKITYCTAPYRSKYGWADDRRILLEKHFNISDHQEDIIFTQSKHMVKADCMIDDLITNIEGFEKNQKGVGFLFTSSFNTHLTREKFDWTKIMNKKFFQYSLERYTNV